MSCPSNYLTPLHAKLGCIESRSDTQSGRIEMSKRNLRAMQRAIDFPILQKLLVQVIRSQVQLSLAYRAHEAAFVEDRSVDSKEVIGRINLIPTFPAIIDHIICIRRAGEEIHQVLGFGGHRFYSARSTLGNLKSKGSKQNSIFTAQWSKRKGKVRGCPNLHKTGTQTKNFKNMNSFATFEILGSLFLIFKTTDVTKLVFNSNIQQRINILYNINSFWKNKYLNRFRQTLNYIVLQHSLHFFHRFQIIVHTPPSHTVSLNINGQHPYCSSHIYTCLPAIYRSDCFKRKSWLQNVNTRPADIRLPCPGCLEAEKKSIELLEMLRLANLFSCLERDHKERDLERDHKE